ncbi:MAG: hypothetical protein ACRCWF_04230 [Beijerinckiaceae bacterium]
MALFVIIVGALLSLGGATSLLFGFDIVMTERGNAMTIAGTIALSGGIVTIAIGLALTRLTQILKALENGRPRPKWATNVGERPVVPAPTVPAESTSAPAADAVSVVTDAKPSTSSHLALGAGIAAAAGIAGGIAVTAKERNADAAPDIESQPAAEAESTPELATEEPVQTTAEDGDVRDDGASSVTMPDLEAELSKALAEADPQLPAVETVPETFNNSLATLLNKPKDRKRKSSPVAATDSTADLPAIEPALAEEVSQAPEDQRNDAEEPDTSNESASLQDEPHTLSEVSLPEPSDSDENATVAQTIEDTEPEPVSIQPPKAGVIGNYTIGDSAYTMFSDGSVEAVTNGEIERYASMDDLRKHLSRK